MPPSLRRSLLRRLAAPLSLLALMSGLMAYWLAWQYTQHVVDRSLADLATAISKQIQLAGVDAPLTVPPLARAMFSDPVEQLIYRISDGETEIAGEHDLPLTGTNVRRIHYAYVFETNYQGTSVRAAQVRVDQLHGNPIVVEVAQRVGSAVSDRGRVHGRDHDAAAAAAAGGLGDRVARGEPAAQSADRSRRYAQPADAYVARTGR